jgi:prepilin-type N-terminal cleavage/methylation domain-containing protein
VRIDFSPAKGFTLVEQLMVVAVIGVLAALLLPALNRTRVKALRPACINNLRQLNLGIRMYADESGGLFPAPKKNGPPDAFVAYTTIMQPYLRTTSTPSNRGLFACPADAFHYDYDEHTFVSKSLHAQSNYSYSSYAFNGGNFPMGKPPAVRWPGIAGLKLSSIKEPAKTVLISEFPALLPYSWHKPGTSGHYNNAQDVVSFIDGHVSFIKIYWNSATPPDRHEAWQYDPPAGYDYKWSGDQ